MRKWWRKFKNVRGWDFVKTQIGKFSALKTNESGQIVKITDDYGIYTYRCKYCNKTWTFPWGMTNLFYHNMQRHIKAKHIDVL